jgi:hypothetical protein
MMRAPDNYDEFSECSTQPFINTGFQTGGPRELANQETVSNGFLPRVHPRTRVSSELPIM